MLYNFAMNELNAILASSKYWFLRKLLLTGDSLSIIVSEGFVSEKPLMIKVAEGKEIGPVKRIAPTSESRHFKIEFEHHISFQRTNESYCWGTGHYCEYSHSGDVTKSSYMDYTIANTAASDEDKQLFKHYIVACMDDVIDVISFEKPSITSTSLSKDISESKCENYLRVFDL
jgi:hypothetical protein